MFKYLILSFCSFLVFVSCAPKKHTPSVRQDRIKAKQFQTKLVDGSEGELQTLGDDESKAVIVFLKNSVPQKDFDALTTPVEINAGDYKNLKYSSSGQRQKLNYTVTNGETKIAEFSNVTLSTSAPVTSKSGDYNLLAFCIDANCQFVYITAFKNEGDKRIENYPMAWKWVEKKLK